ncbi:MAG: hypothetical protein K0S34_2660, partial [Bacillales bacterium]|nr:hypothetical protein [Bacillales bacterium]
INGYWVETYGPLSQDYMRKNLFTFYKFILMENTG